MVAILLFTLVVLPALPQTFDDQNIPQDPVDALGGSPVIG